MKMNGFSVYFILRYKKQTHTVYVLSTTSLLKLICFVPKGRFHVFDLLVVMVMRQGMSEESKLKRNSPACNNIPSLNVADFVLL